MIASVAATDENAQQDAKFYPSVEKQSTRISKRYDL